MKIQEGATLHLLVYWSEEDRVYYARCLDFHVLGHGDTPEEALECLKGGVELYLELCQERNIPAFRRAPEEYWEMFHQAAEKGMRREPLGPHDPRPYAMAV